MSVWTHVAAAIRFDSILKMPQFKPDLGISDSHNSPSEDWDKCTVPCGSEGSLYTHLWTNPENNMAAYTATIWGDLRDYENVGEIIDYLVRITEGKMVRNGVATIEVEGREPVVVQYRDGVWKTLGDDSVLNPTRDRATDAD